MENNMDFNMPFLSAYIIAVSLLAGLVAGSFINCAAMRAARHESVARGRSHCPSCGHTLAAKDLVPLFSWLYLKGRCRYCGARISARYPAAELIGAAVFVSAVVRWGISLRALEMLALGCILIYISLADAETYIIPDRFIVAGIAVRAVFILLSVDMAAAAFWSLVGGLSVAAPVLIIVLIMEKIIKKEAMGGGDIKLLFMTGIYFDWKINILALIIACVAGIVLALASRARRGKPIPFGPAIACGAWLSMLFGEPLLSAYLGLFGL